MTERVKENSSERFQDNGLESEGSERTKQLAMEREQSAAEKEHSSHEKEEAARHEVERAVMEKEKKDERAASPAERRRDAPAKNTKATREAVFKKEMKHVQAELSAPERAFSKLIHNKTVEKASEAVGSTIARPNSILYGSLFAFILVSALYLWARQNGHELSGFETIGAFVVGWLVGLIVDYFRILISGGRSS
jgi:cobalamin biosynthesis Mg chelatase CobN